MLKSVEAEGRVETSVVRKSGRSIMVDRKAALMVYEFKKCSMNIAGELVRPSGLERSCVMLKGT